MLLDVACHLPKRDSKWPTLWVHGLMSYQESCTLTGAGHEKGWKRWNCRFVALSHYHKVKFVEIFPKTQRFTAWIPILRWHSIAYPPAQEFRPSKQLGIYGLEAIDGFVHEVPHKLSIPMDELRLETMKFHGKVLSHVLGQTPINLW